MQADLQRRDDQYGDECAGNAAGARTVGITGTYDAGALAASRIVATLAGTRVTAAPDGTGLQVVLPSA